jgi:hypothetical protein
MDAGEMHSSAKMMINNGCGGYKKSERAAFDNYALTHN